MHILRIEHAVPDFGGWKKAFDSDPLGRKKAGVRRYRVLRPVDDPKCAIVDLEFESAIEAEAMLVALRNLWRQVAGRLMENPHVRILESVESKEY